MSRESIGNRRLFNAGCPLFLEGDRAEWVFRVIKGRVHLTTSSAVGPPSILRIATEGCFLGISSVLLQTVYEGLAIAVVPTTVEVLSRESFQQLMDDVPAFAATAAITLSREYCEMIEHSKLLQSVGNTQERVARFLVGSMRDRRAGTRFKLHYTHDEIGGMIGRSRETVTRTLTLFKQHGIIDVADGVLRIRRPDYLLALAGPMRQSHPDRLSPGPSPTPAIQRRGPLRRLTA
jgi:CRP/FNR family transcriptional regulator